MKKRKKYTGLQRRKAISGYLFILPFILGFLIFMVQPLFQSLYMSFCTVEISSSGFKNVLSGLSNYVRAFTVDTEYNELLVEEISRMCTNSIAIMVFRQYVMTSDLQFRGFTCIL